MPLLKTAAILFSFFISLVSYSQMDFPAFGDFSADEKNVKQCPFDPEAEAIILLDKAVANYDDNYHLITDRRIRIKILSEKGIDRANVAIPFYSKDDFEYINKIQAYTYNFDGSGGQTSVAVEKKSFYSEKTNSYYSLMKFAMPAVKIGSIIEYHYTSTMKSYSGLDEWRFQSDLPTSKSSYLLQMLPNVEFAYNVQKYRNYKIVIQPLPSEGRVYFEMNNVPALRIEPYMDAPRDYLQKVMFQYSAYMSSFGSKQKVNTTWKELAYDLMTDKTFGSQLDKDLKIEEIKLLAANESTGPGKIKAIYEYVNKNIGWNGIESRFAVDGLKTVWERKKGSSGEINLLLVNLLKSAGIEAYPVLAAERDFGKVDTTYPYLEKFNKTVAFAVADGRQYVLDATQENCPVDLTPYSLLNTSAFLVDKKTPGIIKINTGKRAYKNVIIINGSMDTKGVVTAEASVKSYDYARQIRLTAVKNNRGKFINENFQKPYEGLTIDSFLIRTPENDSVPFEQIVRYKQQLNESGGFIFLNINLFTGLEKNPFISSVRFTNVNFGFPYIMDAEEKIKLPAGIKIDLPEDKLIVSPDNKIQAVRQVTFENNELKVLIRFVQTTTLVSSDSYPAMKEFYKKMVDMLNEPIVLKLPN
ncbi:MAG TPA: DUF3857 and transglutaminase domain-containing protein [Chitinophagaceae bacterium]|jgi:transglutaminase-like putative cysteine protease|nr:DUF3857 and transglutaminase domain-containing protein [Chitinophagaceae bacterium]